MRRKDFVERDSSSVGRARRRSPLHEKLDDPSITGEKERETHFGRYDHVRWYGSDIRARIMKAGFSIEEFTATGELAVPYGLELGESLFISRKLHK
jgi:hypothetical protein